MRPSYRAESRGTRPSARRTVWCLDKPRGECTHHQQWIEACKTGSRTGSNFAYAGPFTEIVLLGNVAYRVGKPVTYDPATMRITDVPEANQFLGKGYRKGWEV